MTASAAQYRARQLQRTLVVFDALAGQVDDDGRATLRDARAALEAYGESLDADPDVSLSPAGVGPENYSGAAVFCESIGERLPAEDRPAVSRAGQLAADEYEKQRGEA